MHYHSRLICHRQQRVMEHFINKDLADMHLIYELAEGNTRATERLYRERYPQRDVTDPWMFSNLHLNLCGYRSLRGIFDIKDAPRTGRPVVENVDKITEIIEVNWHVSSRSIAQKLKIDHKTVLNNFRKVGFKKKLDV
ncbi:histone-lysine N-methyltransferase SETMAR [Trichonephila clavipes]|nr:histone-lysine N-methyltransferase SETMAR [Trichonephila clavipes]